MKIVFPALAAAFIATVGAGSPAQAALINFAVDAFGGSLSYAGGSLNASTAFNLDGSSLMVSGLGAGDESGLAVGNTVTVSPTDIIYGGGTGSGSLASDIKKTWTATIGPDVGDVFTETLDSVLRIVRSPNAVTVYLSGDVSDTAGLFTDVPAFFILQANQVGGPGTVVSASFTNTTQLGSVPEPATWVMLALGFAGLGYAAVRRSTKDKTAIAV
jgi:PEP-CTERM motif